MLAGSWVILAGEGMNRAGKDFLKLSHPLTNFKIQKYYQNDRQLS